MASKAFPLKLTRNRLSRSRCHQVEERRPLLGVIPGEELPRDEAIPLEPAQADEEGDRPRPSGEPGRLRVEEKGLTVIQCLEERVVRQDGEASHVERRDVSDAEPPVARGPAGHPVGTEERSPFVFRFCPRNQLLQRDTAAPPGGRRSRRESLRPPGQDGIDPLAQGADLFGPGLPAVLAACFFGALAGQAL